MSEQLLSVVPVSPQELQGGRTMDDKVSVQVQLDAGAKDEEEGAGEAAAREASEGQELRGREGDSVVTWLARQGRSAGRKGTQGRTPPRCWPRVHCRH